MYASFLTEALFPPLLQAPPCTSAASMLLAAILLRLYSYLQLRQVPYLGSLPHLAMEDFATAQAAAQVLSNSHLPLRIMPIPPPDYQRPAPYQDIPSDLSSDAPDDHQAWSPSSMASDNLSGADGAGGPMYEEAFDHTPPPPPPTFASESRSGLDVRSVGYEERRDRISVSKDRKTYYHATMVSLLLLGIFYALLHVQLEMHRASMHALETLCRRGETPTLP
ncbi:hypothetical protein B0H11DRAFT_2231891 [Mycena galericulata]|nr:hypothetical protein B0H11DRAFT_2231891 [Mycena galericulata]